MTEAQKKHARCRHCGYEWDTASTGYYVNCPRCMYKVNIKKSSQPLQTMEHFNLDENGVKILDKSLTTEHSPRGRIVDIYFKQKTAWCEYDESSDCKHIEYALSLPVVQEILKRKGWKVR